MIDRVKILGFNITADLNQHTIEATPYNTNETVSQYEEVILEISTQDIEKPKAIRANFTLTDGTAVNNIYLQPVIGQINKFRIRLNDVIGNKLVVGDNQTVNIGLRLSTESSYAVLPQDVTLGFRLYRTSTDVSYHPTDMDTVFVSLNKLNEHITDIDNRMLDAAGGTVVGDFTVTGKTILNSADIKSGDISNVNIKDSTLLNNSISASSTLTVHGIIDSKDGYIEVSTPRADKPYDAVNKQYADDTIRDSIDANTVEIKNDIVGFENDSEDTISVYGNRNYTTSLFNSLNNSAIASVELSTNVANGQYTLTFTKTNGEKLAPLVIDTPDEKIISNAKMDGNYLVLEFLGDVSPVRVNMSQFITIYTGKESSNITVSVDSTKKEITAEIKDGSITLAKLDAELQTTVSDIPNQELARQKNEEVRKSNESERQTNEKLRITNENTRISNENARVEKFKSWENTLNTFATKAELEEKANRSELFSGNYEDLTNKPVVPTAVSQLTNDSKFIPETTLGSKFKTINGESLIGTGDITVSGGDASIDDTQISTTTTYSSNKIDSVYAKKEAVPAKLSELVNDEGFVDSYYVDGKIKDLVNSAPDTLDTLGELATAIKNNEDVVAAIQDSITNKADRTEVYDKATIDKKLAAITFDPETLNNFYNKTEVDTKLGLKANLADVYTQTQIDGKLDLKANSEDVYTQTEVDNKLKLKADANNVYDKTLVYSKTETNELLDTKANSSTTLEGYGIIDAYTQTEINAQMNLKADKTSIPTKVSQLENDSKFITLAEIPEQDIRATFRTWESVEG